MASCSPASAGVAAEPPPLGAAPGRPGSAGAVPQHTSLDTLAAAAQPAAQPQPCRQQGQVRACQQSAGVSCSGDGLVGSSLSPLGWGATALYAPTGRPCLLDSLTASLPARRLQGDAEVAQLVLRLLERGELSPEKAAALLRQLLPQGSLSQGQVGTGSLHPGLPAAHAASLRPHQDSTRPAPALAAAPCATRCPRHRVAKHRALCLPSCLRRLRRRGPRLGPAPGRHALAGVAAAPAAPAAPDPPPHHAASCIAAAPLIIHGERYQRCMRATLPCSMPCLQRAHGRGSRARGPPAAGRAAAAWQHRRHGWWVPSAAPAPVGA